MRSSNSRYRVDHLFNVGECLLKPDELFDVELIAAQREFFLKNGGIGLTGVPDVTGFFGEGGVVMQVDDCRSTSRRIK